MNKDISFLKSIKKIYSYLPPLRKRQLPILIGLILLGSLTEILTLTLVLPFINLITDNGSAINSASVNNLMLFFDADKTVDILEILTIFLIILIVGSGILRTIMTWFLYRFSFGLGYDFTAEIYKRTLFQEYNVHLLRNSSEVLGGINKSQIMVGNVILPMLKGVAALIMSMSIVLLLFFINSSVTLGLIGFFVIVYVLLSKLVKGRLRKNSTIIANGQSSRIKSVQEGLGGIRDIILDSSQSIFISRFKFIEWALRRAQGQNALMADIPRYLVEALVITAMCIIAYGLSTSGEGVITSLPLFGVFALASQKLIPLMQMVYVNWTQVSGNYAVIADVIELLEQPMPLKKSLEKVKFNQEISLKVIDFKFPSSNNNVLRNISFTIPKGARLGFIGTTGSGKSTLLDIVMGLLQPTEGKVEIDGLLLNVDNITSWQQQVAHVPQAVYISDLSIAENIAFGAHVSDIDFNKMAEVIEKAQLGVFVAKQEKGLNTLLGEQGVLISGGERQRIGIARALYKDVDVLILDEATSALDDKTERDIMLSIDKLGNDITVLIIAHRLSTLSKCDAVIRLNDGELVGKGTYGDIVSHGDFN